MAYAMMGGIIVGTLLTLLFLPALYVAWFRIKEPEQDRVPVSSHASPISPLHHIKCTASELSETVAPALASGDVS